MDQVRELVQNVVQNVNAMTLDAYNFIEAQTGLSPVVLFTVFALLLGSYFLISGILVPSQIGTAPASETPQSAPSQVGGLTEAELANYDGKDSDKPLLMAIKGQIYDVSSARAFYGPGGPYAVFAGKDASRALAKMSFEAQDLTGDLDGLSDQELEVLKDWENKIVSKYHKVGFVVAKISEPVKDDKKDGVESREVGVGGESERKEKEPHSYKEAALMEKDSEHQDKEKPTILHVRDDATSKDPSEAAEVDSKSGADASHEDKDFEMVEKGKIPVSSSEGETVTSIGDSEDSRNSQEFSSHHQQHQSVHVED